MITNVTKEELEKMLQLAREIGDKQAELWKMTSKIDGWHTDPYVAYAYGAAQTQIAQAAQSSTIFSDVFRLCEAIRKATS